MLKNDFRLLRKSFFLLFIFSSSVKADECIRPLPFDSVCLEAEIAAAIKYDDNIFRSRSKKGSSVYVLSPRLSTFLKNDNNRYSLTLNAARNDYSRFQTGSFLDYGLSGRIEHELNSRHRINLDVTDELSHDLSSEEERENLFLEYRQRIFSGKYGFGSKRAKAHIDFEYQLNTRSYEDSGFNDRRLEDYELLFFLQLMPDTDAVFEVSHRSLQYPDLGNTGYEVSSYLAGFNWNYSSKTLFFLKLGRRYQAANESQAGKEGFTGWDAGLTYKPRTYSVFKLTTGQDYDYDYDEPQSANFIQARFIDFSWRHGWSAKLATRLGWIYSDDRLFDGSGTWLKQRDIYKYSIGLFYEPRRWLTVSLNWKYTVRREDSFSPDYGSEGYNRNQYLMTGKITL